MAFDTNQPAYREFREILKQRIEPVLIWTGAGLSAPANVPTWIELRDKVLASASKVLPHLEKQQAELSRVKGLLQAAEHSTNLWEAFRCLKSAMHSTSFVSAIRTEISPAIAAPPPEIYKSLWCLGARGFITLNIDRFASRSFAQVFSGGYLAEFHGADSRYQADILRGGSKFVVNLHGTLEEEKSWVFTPEDFHSLQQAPGFKEFISTCFLACTVVFVGVSAEDEAAGGYLEKLKSLGCSIRGHFWITDRNNEPTRTWAESAGIRLITYSPENNHLELSQAVSDLSRYIPSEVTPDPVVPSTKRERGTIMPPPEEVERLTAEEIRQILNKEAVRILSTNHPEKLQQYQSFWETYAEAIHRAWSVSTKLSKNRFFDYELTEPLAAGAFGQVYRGKDSAGKEVAIKILHNTAKDEHEMLQGFRRGVRAMQILSTRGVDGMVPYIAQWEIPAATVMEFVNGFNLQDAVEAGYIDSWEDTLEIASQLAGILKKAHAVPEHVLHRDLRPPNVMLRYSGEEFTNWEVVVLDFDLAWHKDAMELSIGPRNSANGYMAPEQADASRRYLSRNSLVDSFGFGMTMFFTISRTAPSFGQQKHVDWEKVLQDRIAYKRCDSWVSLPKRFARLINYSTKDEQTYRWDFSRISGEIERLREALRGRQGQIRSCELITEEIAARCPELSSYYDWNIDRHSATISLRSGFDVAVIALEPDGLVRLEIDWSNTGDVNFESFRKYLGPTADKCCKALKEGGWQINPGDKQVTSGSARIVAHIKASVLSSIASISNASLALSNGIRALRLS